MTWARGGRPILSRACSLICLTFSNFRFGIGSPFYITGLHLDDRTMASSRHPFQFQQVLAIDPIDERI